MSWQSSPRVGIVPLCICRVHQKLLGARGFSQPSAVGWAEHVVRLQGKAGRCIDKSFFLLKETAPADVPCTWSSCFTAYCFILVPSLRL